MKSLILLPLCTLLVFCGLFQKNNFLDGRWHIHHILIDDKDITDNPLISTDMYSVPHFRTKRTLIQNDSIYIGLEIRKKAYGAKAFITKKNVLTIFSEDAPFLNDNYEISIDTVKKKVDGIKALDIQVKLKSKNKIIFMNKMDVDKTK